MATENGPKRVRSVDDRERLALPSSRAGSDAACSHTTGPFGCDWIPGEQHGSGEGVSADR